MKAPPSDRRLEALTHLMLDGDLPPEGAEELAGLLRQHAEYRKRYLRMVAVHQSLMRAGRNEAEGLSATPLPLRNLSGRRYRFWAIAAAAIALWAGVWFWRMPQRTNMPLAVLSGTAADIWENSVKPELSFHLGGAGKLTSGFAEITYGSGVKVVLEGPCHFEVTGEQSMHVSEGRASVKVPKGHRGFVIDTPGGKITDLGTEFGVAVGKGDVGAVVLSEVFEGEIQIQGKDATARRLIQGESMAILKDERGVSLASTIDDLPVKIANPARVLPAANRLAIEGRNLALGKPVFSPNYYTSRSGEVFPPDKLTDGRLNDSGVPGNWSFWLTPNGMNGEFTVDLLKAEQINRVEFQNTRNRNHGDRGLREFSIWVSEDNATFREVARGELKRVDELPPPGENIPFESFLFPAVTARYVKVVGLSHWRNESRPTSNPNEGGGLNEVQIYGP